MLGTLLFLAATATTGAGPDGVVTSGGVPDRSLAECGEAAQVAAPIGSETTRINLWIGDPAVTATPVQVQAGFEFKPGQVRFYNRGADGRDVSLDLAIERASDGNFHGTITVDGRSAALSCNRLDDRFRPMAPKTAVVLVRHGGKRCDAHESCVGYIGGLIPQELQVPLRFSVEQGALVGAWRLEKDVFDHSIELRGSISQKREQPFIVELRLGEVGVATPTMVTLEAERRAAINLQTPAWSVPEGTLSVWEELSATFVQ